MPSVLQNLRRHIGKAASEIAPPALGELEAGSLDEPTMGWLAEEDYTLVAPRAGPFNCRPLRVPSQAPQSLLSAPRVGSLFEAGPSGRLLFRPLQTPSQALQALPALAPLGPVFEAGTAGHIPAIFDFQLSYPPAPRQTALTLLEAVRTSECLPEIPAPVLGDFRSGLRFVGGEPVPVPAALWWIPTGLNQWASPLFHRFEAAELVESIQSSAAKNLMPPPLGRGEVSGDLSRTLTPEGDAQAQDLLLLSNVQQVMASPESLAEKGMSPVATPLALAKAVAWRLPLNRAVTVDLTCGDGRLLIGAGNETTRHILGADVDPCHTFRNKFGLRLTSLPVLHLNKIIGDLGKIAPLLHDVHWQADLFALNPPFDCHWHTDAFKFLGESDLMDVRAAYRVGSQRDTRCAKGTMDSTMATLMTALNFCSERGEGVMIANADTLDRLLFNIDAPYQNIGGRIWHYDKLKGNPMTGSDTGNFGAVLTTGIIYFARQHTSGCANPVVHEDMETLDSDAHGDAYRRSMRGGAVIGSPGHYNPDTIKLWQAVKDEHRQRTDQARNKQFNIWLNAEGKVETQLSVYEQHSVKVDKDLAEKLFTLNGRRPIELVMQRAQRQALLETVNGGIWKVHPELPTQIDDAIRQYNSVRAPLAPLSEIQRMGYLDEADMIVCKQDLRDPLTRRVIFREGQSYPLRSQSVKLQRMVNRPDSKGRECDFLLQGNELAIFIKDACGTEQCFMDARLMSAEGFAVEQIKPDHPLQAIPEIFEVPEVPSVADSNPEKFRFYQSELDRIVELSPSKQPLKGFQRMDIASAALSDGLIGAWEPGLGKTRKGVLWPLLKVGCEDRRVFPKGRVLLVAPENLHNQMEEEARAVFGVSFIKLNSIAAYEHLRPLPPGFYIASFTQVASNGVAKMPDPHDFLFNGSRECYAELAAMMTAYNVSFDDARNAKFEDELDGTKQYQPVDKVLRLCKERCEQYGEGVGKEVAGIRCVYSPSLADVTRKAFDCVVFDEGTKLKGEDTLVGSGCRLLAPKYRMVLTATPIKNRLPDIFWLAQWASGGFEEATPRWPYTMDPGEQERFASEFLVTERNLTKERHDAISKGRPAPTLKELKKKQKRGSVTADVCNIHRLWKLLAPIVLRRTKRDIGEYMVPKVKRTIRVPMGEKQALTYKYHLSATYLDRNGNPVILPQLQALRSCAAAPNSALLSPVLGTRMEDDDKCQIPDPDQYHRSASDYTPKMAAALNIIAECMERGEQVVLFSALHEPLDTLSGRLAQAGIPHDVLDGRSSPKTRGALSALFKKGLPHAKPVLLCGINAMAEGNSWHHCNNAVLLAFDWAYNLYEQAINRVHRLNSYRPVNIYPIIAEGTIDRRLESLTGEKGDAAELVLDGQLLGEQIEEVNLAELLKFALAEFANVNTVPEHRLEEEWDALRDRLENAYIKNCGTNWQQPQKVAANPTGVEPSLTLSRLEHEANQVTVEREAELEPDPTPWLDGSESEGNANANTEENTAVVLVRKIVPIPTQLKWF